MTNVILEPMNQQEYEQFIEQAIIGYAKDHVTAGNWKEEDSVELARNEFNQLLPQGLESPENFLLKIVNQENKTKLGYVWFNIRDKAKHKAFIYYIFISEDHRGKGYGKLAMKALDKEVKKYGVTQINLHVFGHNPTAIELYKKMGYEVTNLMMAKQL